MEGEMEGEVEGEAEYPAVIVEPVPSARMEQGFAAQVLVYDDETYLMQGVAEEQEVETEVIETGKSRTVQTTHFFCHLIDPLFSSEQLINLMNVWLNGINTTALYHSL